MCLDLQSPAEFRCRVPGALQGRERAGQGATQSLGVHSLRSLSCASAGQAGGGFSCFNYAFCRSQQLNSSIITFYGGKDIAKTLSLYSQANRTKTPVTRESHK